MKGKLVLEDGAVFYGDMLDERPVLGEVVFNTGMTGYQEILTDPSYCSQIVTLTYPLIGNYGAAKKFNQSRKCFFNGFIIGELCDIGSNWQKEEELAEFLKAQDIPCLYNVDTRAVTRHIRSLGAMKGVLVPETATQEEIDALMRNEIPKEVVKIVTTPKTYKMENPGGPHVVVMDFGIKQHILDSLHGIGCDLTIVPADTKADEIMALNPDGIFLSNGPGDPKDLPEIIEVVREIAGKKPTFGICLGHQLLSLAFGADTYKAILELESEKRRRADLSKEEAEAYEKELLELKHERTNTFNLKQTYDPSKEKDKIKEAGKKISELDTKIRAFEKEHEQKVKERANSLAHDTAYNQEFDKKMAELKAKHAKEVSEAISAETEARNEILAKEVYLSVGRFGFRKRMKQNNALLDALKEAMQLGVDLNDEEQRNAVFDKVTFRVKYLDENSERLHGTCILNLANIKDGRDWSQIRAQLDIFFEERLEKYMY